MTSQIPFGKAGKFPRCTFGHKKFVASRFIAFQEPREKGRSASRWRLTRSQENKWQASEEHNKNVGGGGRDYWNAAGWVSPLNE